MYVFNVKIIAEPNGTEPVRWNAKVWNDFGDISPEVSYATQPEAAAGAAQVIGNAISVGLTPIRATVENLPAPPRHALRYDPRYWLLTYGYPGEPNGIDAASEATGLPLVGLVDDEAGGVIGYLSAFHAARVLDTLNPDDRKIVRELDRASVERIEDALRDAAAALKGHDNPEKIALIELAHYIKHGPEED